jgi:hypothetical protein
MITPGDINAEQAIQMRRIFWAPHYWLNLFNHVLFRYLLWLTLPVGAALGLIASVNGAHEALLCTLLALATIVTVVLTIVRSQVPSRKTLAKLNDDFPKSIELDHIGVHCTFRIGSILTVPWAVSTSWRTIGDLLILNELKGPNLTIVSLSHLTPAERLEVEAIFAEHLGPARPFESPPKRGVFRRR